MDEPRLPPPGVLPAASGPPPLLGEPPGAVPLAAAAASASSRAASALAAVRMLDCGCAVQAGTSTTTHVGCRRETISCYACLRHKAEHNCRVQV